MIVESEKEKENQIIIEFKQDLFAQRYQSDVFDFVKIKAACPIYIRVIV